MAEVVAFVNDEHTLRVFVDHTLYRQTVALGDVRPR